eukprot:275805-Pelagomonas_calceolata.AAC.1
MGKGSGKKSTQIAEERKEVAEKQPRLGCSARSALGIRASLAPEVQGLLAGKAVSCAVTVAGMGRKTSWAAVLPPPSPRAGTGERKEDFWWRSA